MELVVIAYGLADIADGQLGQLQKLGGLCHAVIQQKILRSPTDCIFKNLPEITAVQAAVICNIFHGDIVLKILFDESQSLVDIEIPEFAGFGSDEADRCDGTGQGVQKKIQVSHEVKGSHIAVLCNIQHFLHHGLPDVPGMGMIDRSVGRKPGN